MLSPSPSIGSRMRSSTMVASVRVARSSSINAAPRCDLPIPPSPMIVARPARRPASAARSEAVRRPSSSLRPTSGACDERTTVSASSSRGGARAVVSPPSGSGSPRRSGRSSPAASVRNSPLPVRVSSCFCRRANVALTYRSLPSGFLRTTTWARSTTTLRQALRASSESARRIARRTGFSLVFSPNTPTPPLRPTSASWPPPAASAFDSASTGMPFTASTAIGRRCGPGAAGLASGEADAGAAIATGTACVSAVSKAA